MIYRCAPGPLRVLCPFRDQPHYLHYCVFHTTLSEARQMVLDRPTFDQPLINYWYTSGILLDHLGHTHNCF